MAEFFVGEFGPLRPLKLDMLFDATVYTTVRFDVYRPSGFPPLIDLVPTTITSVLVQRAWADGELPVAGTYSVEGRCYSATDRRCFRATFEVG